MNSPRLSKFLLKVLACRRNRTYLGDVEEIYSLKAEKQGADSACRWYRREIIRSLPMFILESIRWRIIMLKQYFKTALRHFRRDKGYSLLNMAGLAIGLACCALLTLWVRDEVGWDRFHENSSLIYRLVSNSPAQPAPLGPHLKAVFPEIAEAVRFYNSYPLSVKYGEKTFSEGRFVLADPSVFDVFTIPFIAGNRDSALAEPNTVVLTEAAAAKYFGGENPVGRVLSVENLFDVRVTGIVRNPPKNSDIQFNILGEFRILGHFLKDYETHWGNHQYTTYVRLAVGADAASVIPKIAHVVKDRVPETPALLTMKPLSRIHLFEDGAIKYVAIFTLAAMFILAIAACNFINLTTARSGRRAKEIAVRKVAGAVRPQLINQFLSESVLLSLGAFLIAMTAVALSFPAFNAITGKSFSLSDLLKPGIFLFLLGGAAAVGILSGAYPAFLLSSFHPAGLLKSGSSGTSPSTGGAPFRKTLVIIQFALATVFLAFTLLIHKQIVFIRDYDLGIQKENILILQAKEPILKSREAFIGDLTRRPGIVNAAFVSSLPSSVNNVADGMEWEGMASGHKPAWLFVATDSRYLDTLGLTLVEGRNFPGNMTVNEVPYFIVNQKAAKEMNLEKTVGARFSLWRWNGTVIGVVKDFHSRPLRERIQPLVMFVFPRVYGQILVKIHPEQGNTPDIVARIKDVWDKYVPETPFAYEFLDTVNGRNYGAEQKMGREFQYFSFLGIFISCLGLIGLAAYIAERKRKEIGIRKVLGATLSDILKQINKEFFWPILISNLIAWPAAYWAMKMWLRGFAFHTNVSLSIFFISAVSALAIAFLTVSVQSFRAARESPARSLKSE
ncbi:MAG: ABC transporter permease [Candidatus Aminicenantes bacterium]|nr:ABC transporter permease [Candidatus Aminicenantes bacterium]